MPAITQPANLFQDRKDFYHFLSNCKKLSLEKDCAQIVSISLAIDPVEPLAVLDTYHKPHQLHFYIEQNPYTHLSTTTARTATAPKGELLRIAAIDAVAWVTLKGSQRFLQAQKFIDHSLKNTIASGALDLPFAGPFFFSSFTFFDDVCSSTAVFPAATIFLPRWQVARYKNTCVLVANLSIHAQSNLEELVEQTHQQIQSIGRVKSSISELLLNPLEGCLRPVKMPSRQLEQAATDCLKQIAQAQLHKIVLAQAIEVVSPLPFNPIASLYNLRRLYPDCYVFSVGNGQGQHFIGASPERLLSLRDRHLITDALAGSARRGSTRTADLQLAQALLHNQKERYEHQLVVDFIRQRLQQLGLIPESAAVPQLLRLTNIQHLHTSIQALVPPDIHPLEILSELHPTPAVAGVPREVACQLIRRYETFERGLYAAPLGWIDSQGNSEFIVGIRSALIQGTQAQLYAGAGIVAGSDPKQEVAEIQLKFQALLQALV